MLSPYRYRFILAMLLASAMVMPQMSCDRHAPPNAPEVLKIHVLSSVYPLASIAQQVGGPQAEVEWFCENGQDPRDLRLSDEQTRHAHQADLILTSGFREKWAGDTLEAHQQAVRLLLPESTSTGRTLPDDHGALWLDPQVAREMAQLIAGRLTLLDAKHDQEYRQRADVFVKEADAVDAEFRARLAPFKGRKFLSLRTTWSTLAQHYGLEEIAPINAEAHKLTDEDVRKLKDAALENKTDVLAIDAALLPGVQRELQQRTGLRLLPLDPLGSSAPDGRSTWSRIMRYNLEQLVNGLR